MIKKDKRDWKFVIFFAIICFLFLVSYVILDRYLDNKAFKKDFETYKYYNITENASDSMNLKKALFNDNFFINIVSFSEYNGSLETQNSKELLRYYMFALNKSNNRIYKVDDSYTKMCMDKSDFYSSIKEMFILNNSSIKSLNYIDFIEINSSTVCFDLSVLDDIDEARYVGIKSFSVDDSGIITCQLYYYSVYTEDMNTENEVENLLLTSIENNELESFNTKFINNYGGIVKEKIVKFKENPDGNYFKYSLISLETLQ